MYKGYKVFLYSSWNEFKSKITNDLCGKTFFPERQFVFRGQRNNEWTLTTSFDRMFGSLEFNLRKDIEKTLITEFRNSCIELIGREKIIEYNDVEILSLGQHYGVPTRLLDWSYSIYVAAFFAFAHNKNDDSDNIAIWTINTEHEIWNGDYGVEIVRSRLDENEYQKNQKGIFTLNKSPYVDLEGFVGACHSQRHNIEGSMAQILIPYEDRNVALNDLDMMGINHMRLFSGLEGCAQTALLKGFVKYNLK